MKSLFLFLALLSISSNAVTNSSGRGVVGTVAAGTNNVPVAYDATAGSRIINGLSPQSKGHLTVQNLTATALAVSFGKQSCASTNSDEMYVAANSANTKDFVDVQAVVCIRSLGSAISVGTVYAEVW